MKSKNNAKTVSNSITESYPSVVSEWDIEKNYPLTPNDFSTGSNKKVWWKCIKGHSFESTPYHHILRKQGCPYCSGKKILTGFNDLKTRNPVLSEEWNYDKNGDVFPDTIALNSHVKYWWKCNQCKYEWQASPNDRSRGRSCPMCARKIRSSSRKTTLLNDRKSKILSNDESLMAEWDYQKNTLNPKEILLGSNEKVWWRCDLCGCSWQAQVKNRANGSGCPKCMKHMRTSFPEQAIIFYMKQFYPETENGYVNWGYDRTELDVYIPSIKTGIEYDGRAFHSSTKASDRMVKKYEMCKKCGIRLIRISEFENKIKCSDVFFVRTDLNEAGINSVIIQLFDYLGITADVDVVRDRGAIMNQYITSLKERSLASKYPDKAKKWDVEKNGGIRPNQVSAFSNTKYWWICPQGHSYQATPVNEVIDTKTCPICSNHRLLTGFNDLATKNPEMAKEWDFKSNFPIRPEDVLYRSNKKYWWICDQGHSYIAAISNRYYGETGCPYCSNHKVLQGYNDLATINPILASEWCYELNGNLKPEEVLPGSNKKVWWICRYGHKWEATITSRNGKAKAGCPCCARNRTNQQLL